MPVLSYQVNSPGQGGVNPKITYIFTDDSVATVTTPNYIDWLANQQGIYTGDVALVVTRETPTSTLGAGFYEFVRIGMTNHWNLVPQSSVTVDSVTGTVNEIIANPTIGDVIVSIYPNPRLPGTGSVGLPKGTTGQQAGVIGSIRFNTQTTVFEGTLDGTTWVPFATGPSGGVTSLAGTVNQIVVSAATGNVTISIDPDPILPGTASVTLPSGTTAQRGIIAGSLRFNTQTGSIELTNDGTNWYTVLDTNNGVSSVTGTANRITVTGTTNAVIDIASTYIGQTSITTLGTVVTGTWNATTITVPFGGTSKTSFTSYAPICGGTTSTSALQSADTGFSNSGYILQSNGASALPSWVVNSNSIGAAKMWLVATGDGITIQDSFNVSSITPFTPGTMIVTLTTPFAAAWSPQVSCIPAGSGNFPVVSAQSTSTVTVRNSTPAGSGTVPSQWYVCGFGTQ